MKAHNILLALAAAGTALTATASQASDSISAAPGRLHWRVGAELSPAWVIGTNSYLRGEDTPCGSVDASFSGALRADFSFSPCSQRGMLYRGLYQGIGVDMRSFFKREPLGAPASLFVYQGMPVARFGRRLTLDYEWKFGAAFGWHHYSGTGIPESGENVAVSTSVTAHMAIGLKLRYLLSPRWQLSAGIEATHFSNGNSSYPNGGVNSLGAAVGLAYLIGDMPDAVNAPAALAAEADRHSVFYDIMIFGAWRRRGITLPDGQNELCPGRFGVVGLQFAPSYRLNRYVAAGLALDMQWDESAGLAPYWVEGSYGENIRFRRPPFTRQLSAGLSAHAELTMPIFAVNAGLGYDFISPRGNKRFYQSLTLKAFVSRHVYINVGYRLSAFKEPQNLMLGLGVRLH